MPVPSDTTGSRNKNERGHARRQPMVCGISPRGLFPTPAWHRLFRGDVRAGLRDRHRDAAPPLEVLAKAAAKALVRGQAHFICGLDKHLDEPSPLLLGDGEVRVVAEQRSVASQL